jgi:hypothetical protein
MSDESEVPMAQTKSVVFSSMMTSIRSLSLPVKSLSVQMYGYTTERKQTFSVVIVCGSGIAADLGQQQVNTELSIFVGEVLLDVSDLVLGRMTMRCITKGDIDVPGSATWPEYSPV